MNNGLSKQDFDRIKTIMRDIPIDIDNGETQVKYFERLNAQWDGLPCRSVLNMIYRSQNYKEYCELRASYNGKKKNIVTQEPDLLSELAEEDTKEPADDTETVEDDDEVVKIRVAFELGDTARLAINGLLALVGVKL